MPRRIRFAPLVDPRQSLIEDDDNEDDNDDDPPVSSSRRRSFNFLKRSPSPHSRSSKENSDPVKPSSRMKSFPLTRSLSIQDSSKLSPIISFFTLKPKSPPPPLSPVVPLSPLPRHKGARMLNGRIYGAPAAAAANRPSDDDDDDPEFVEWGYGGMGSVNGAKSAGIQANNAVNWERLMGGSQVIGDHDPSSWIVPGGGRGGAGSRRRKSSEEKKPLETTTEILDDDDGSGLAWVKKRKKMRELERERESLSLLVDSPTQTTIKPNDHHPHSVNTHHDHVMKAVSVPMPDKKKETPERSESSLTSDSSSEDCTSTFDQQDDVSSEDEDEDEDDDKRRTAICAGVEKIVRH